MTTKVMRKVVKIDEEKCNGCGACAPSCREGALKIVDGKARLISDVYCDGLGACLGECPQGAITIEERPADEFDEAAVHEHLHEEEHEIPCGCPSSQVRQFEKEEELADEGPLPCGCPSASVRHFEKESAHQTREPSHRESELTHWPVQLTLVPPGAPFLKGADILLAAHCVPFACASFHEEFLLDHALLTACPKLDDFAAHQAKLTQILKQAQPRSVTVVRMEVPCCSGLTHMAQQAIAASGQDIPLREAVISVRGETLEDQ